MIEKLYFKLTDPLTGTVTKDIGWRVTKVQKRIHKKKIGNEWVVTKDEDVPTTYLRGVKELDAVEISKREYDAIDTSEESKTIARRRKSKEETLELFLEKEEIHERKKNN